jgi:general secretion pathway protein D
VKLDRSVVVDMFLEVSSLGQNLGTADEPAFAIGTRNVSTEMVLDDSETAIIGGLIRDEDRQTTQRVPGLGNIPSVGRVFRSNDGQGVRTDILLTLTPRILRGRDVPGPATAEFFSGSGNRVTSEPSMDFLVSGGGSLPTIRLDLSGTASPSDGITAPVALPSPIVPGSTASGPLPTLSFSRSAYETQEDQDVEVVVSASGFDSDTSGTLVIRFRPDLVEANGVRTVGSLPARIDNSRGEIEIDLDNRISGAGTRDIATISFRALGQGLSYLIFSNNFGSGPNVDIPENIELRASRIVIR